MAKKVILQSLDEKQQLVHVVPITRGDLVLDSSGNPAFHSEEFLATDSWPGLTSIHFVKLNDEELPTYTNSDRIQLKVASNSVYPITESSAVICSDAGKSLSQLLQQNTLILDERPTENHTTCSVSSDGIYKELQETVGNIHDLLQRL